MSRTIKRGFSPNDTTEFGEQSLEKLFQAGQDLYYLLNRNYKVKGASTFIGNHFMLTERQRLALVRAVSSKEHIQNRKNKEIQDIPSGSVIHIDGFNTIITLEVALSQSLLLKSMDGTIRDLAGLRGTYRLIDHTTTAIQYIGETLEKNKVSKVIFYLDAPVSNSGRLKQRILDVFSDFSFVVQVEIINQVDTVLEKLDYVVTSDAIILDKCMSWVNLNAKIMEQIDPNYPYVDFYTNIK